MRQEFYQSLISTENPTFIEIVESALGQEKSLVLLLRYSNSGGNREYFLLRSFEDFQLVLTRTRPGDALTIFFEQSFHVRGIVNSTLQEEALSYLNDITQNGNDAIFVIRCDAISVALGLSDMKCILEANQLEDWLSNNIGIPIIIGELAFWEDNSDEKITAYVPDVDGQVHLGAY